MVKTVHFLAAVLLHRQHFSERSCKIIFRPILELLFAECDQIRYARLFISFLHNFCCPFRQRTGGRVFSVPLFHDPQDAVKNIPFAFVMLIEGRGLDADSICNLIYTDSLISLFCEQLYRFDQDSLFRGCVLHNTS